MADSLKRTTTPSSMLLVTIIDQRKRYRTTGMIVMNIMCICVGAMCAHVRVCREEYLFGSTYVRSVRAISVVLAVTPHILCSRQSPIMFIVNVTQPSLPTTPATTHTPAAAWFGLQAQQSENVKPKTFLVSVRRAACMPTREDGGKTHRGAGPEAQGRGAPRTGGETKQVKFHLNQDCGDDGADLELQVCRAELVACKAELREVLMSSQVSWSGSVGYIR